MKSKFLANMSHELRTPLHTVNGFSDLLLEQSSEPLVPKQQRYFENILANGKYLLQLYNLMSNAVKFTGPGRITISAARGASAGGWVEVIVADTGIGIRADDRKRIFREFEQVDGAHSRKYEGTGRGLSLTRRLVELQGGSIRLESEFGSGSRFIVRLPANAEAPRNKTTGGSSWVGVPLTISAQIPRRSIIARR